MKIGLIYNDLHKKKYYFITKIWNSEHKHQPCLKGIRDSNDKEGYLKIADMHEYKEEELD